MVRTARRLHARQRFEQRGVLRLYFALALAPHLPHALAQVGEAGPVVACGFRKIRATEKRRALGREEHGERPAAVLLRQQVVRALVDLVKVWPLLAIDLDIDEQPVHHRRDAGVLERLVRHHVTPMAGRVADRQQNRLVLRARLGERFVAPREPVDRIVLMLLQVGTGFAGEAVFGSG